MWRHKIKGGVYRITVIDPKRGDVYLHAQTKGYRSTWKAECLLPSDYEQSRKDKTVDIQLMIDDLSELPTLKQRDILMTTLRNLVNYVDRGNVIGGSKTIAEILNSAVKANP